MATALPQNRDPECAGPYLPWDRVCDLLGGADWSTIPEPLQSLPPLLSRFSLGPQFLFQDDPARLPLECFWLKLSAFAWLCRRVTEFYQQYQRPYLSLDPTHISVRVTEPSFTRLPARWLFDVQINSAMGAQPIDHETMPMEMAQHIFTPCENPEAVYVAPLMRQWPMGRELPVTILLRSLERIPDDTDEQLSRGLIQAHTFSESISLSDCSEQDAFRLILRLPGSGPTPIHFWARKVEGAERGLIVSGVTDAIPHATWSQLERAKQQVFSNAQVMVYRAFGHMSDLYSLGMLLFRGLLVHECQSLEQVQQHVVSVLQRLEPIVQGLNPEDNWTLFTRLSGRLKEEGSVFRSPSNSIPEPVWYGALICGLRLVSAIRGFSFCGSANAMVNTPIPQALQDAMRAAESLAEQARIDLFEAPARYHELIRVCERALAERT